MPYALGGTRPVMMPGKRTAWPGRGVDNWVPLAVGDFNGDGRSEILWQESVTGHVKIQASLGSPRALEPIIGQIADKTIACVGDFNGDGRDEVLWRPSTDIVAAPLMWFFDSLGRLTSTSDVSRTLDFATYSIAPVAGKRTLDTNGDGKADIVIRGNGVVSDYVWCMNGATVLTETVGGTGQLRVVSTAWHMMFIADCDNSGTGDIVWREYVTGDTYYYPLTGSTIGAGEGFIRQVTDLNWVMLESGQFDNAGGKGDVLWRNMTLSADQRGYVYSLNGAVISTNEGFVDNMSLFDDYSLIGVGDFLGLGRRTECLWWNTTTRLAKLARITFNGGHEGAVGQYTISAGTEVA